MQAFRMMCFAALAALAGCGEQMPDGDPAARLSTDLRGYRAPVGVMMGADEKPFWVQAALKGFRPVKPGDVPAKLEQRESVSGCNFTRPAYGDRVALVETEESSMTGPVYAFSRQDVGHRAEILVENHKNMGKGHPTTDAGHDQFEVVDVVVTERAKPVHLVLVSAGGGLLFNVHRGDGVRISRVSVIGVDNMAVANLDPSVPVEFLAGAAKESCQVAPVRRPADHWTFVRNVKEAGGSMDDLLEQNYVHASRWSAWTQSTFGIPGEPGTIGAARASHVLVGPLPASPKERVQYRPLKGATVLVSREDYLLAGSDADYRKLNGDLVTAAATEAAGGDLASLHPKES